MMRVQGVSRGLALVAALISLGVAAWLRPYIETEREALQLEWDSGEIGRPRGLPPELAITGAALGTFRGLAVNILWLRALGFQQEGRYHEALQLSRWITQLQPRFPQVWAFQASNLAYDISELTPSSRERWMWILAGIRLLRDEAIPIHPRSLFLYDKLALLYSHKIGGFSDPHHEDYRQRFAREWQALLGDPPGHDVDALVAWLDPLVEAPRDPAELAKAFPATGALLSDWRARGPWRALELLGQLGQDDEAGADRASVAALSNEERSALAAFLRATLLRKEYKMDPARMRSLTRSSGPIDWRHPAAHALYWISTGLERYREREGRDAVPVFVRSQANQRLLGALRQLTLEGRIVPEREGGRFVALPQPRFVDSYLGIVERATRDLDPEDGARLRLQQERAMGFIVGILYRDGDLDAAARRYAEMAAAHGNSADPEDPYATSLDRFVLERVVSSISTLVGARRVVEYLFFQALRRGSAVGRPQTAVALDTLAVRVHEKVEEAWLAQEALEEAVSHEGHGADDGHGHGPVAAPAESLEAELGSLEEIRATARLRFFRWREEEIPRAEKERAWRALPAEAQTRLREQGVDLYSAEELQETVPSPGPPRDRKAEEG